MKTETKSSVTVAFLVILLIAVAVGYFVGKPMHDDTNPYPEMSSPTFQVDNMDSEYEKNKAFAVIFKHMEGWTISAVEFSKDSVEKELACQKEVLPDFKYRIVPIEMSFHVIK